MLGASQVALVVKNPSANAGDARDVGSIPGSGRSPGGGNGNLHQYSCLENSMDREPCRLSPWDFSRQEYWSGLPFPPPGDLPDPGIELMSSGCPALAGRFFTTDPLGKPPSALDGAMRVQAS